MKSKVRGKIYRIVMKIAHKYNWHYAPPIYPDGDTHLWCKWCGFRESYSGKHYKWIKGKGIVTKGNLLKKLE